MVPLYRFKIKAKHINVYRLCLGLIICVFVFSFRPLCTIRKWCAFAVCGLKFSSHSVWLVCCWVGFVRTTCVLFHCANMCIKVSNYQQFIWLSLSVGFTLHFSFRFCSRCSASHLAQWKDTALRLPRNFYSHSRNTNRFSCVWIPCNVTLS